MILGSFTYGRIIEEIKVAMGFAQLDESVCPDELIFDKLNEAITLYHSLTGLLDNPKYREKYTLTTNTLQDEVDISALEDFKIISEFTSVNDSLKGRCIEKTEDEFNTIAVYARGNSFSDWADEIIYYVAGEQMYFCKGARTFYGTRSAMAIRKPRINLTYDLSALVDVLDEHKAGVTGMVVKQLAPIVKVAIPANVDDAIALLPVKKAEKKETEKKFEVKNA